MPSTIPYDPSLALGNIVSQDALATLVQIGNAQVSVDQLEDNLNALISLRRSLDMTVVEMTELGADVSTLETQIKTVSADIVKAANAYAAQKYKTLQDVTKIKQDATARANGSGNSSGIIHVSPESPIDYDKTQIKKMPLSSDSLKMNVQYFSLDNVLQKGETMAATVRGFVSESMSFLGDDIASQQSAAAATQINSQYSNHTISGTLVISIACTHKDAVLLAPFVLDVDKAIRVWNQLYPADQINVDSNDPATEIAGIAAAPPGKSPGITLLSGATYGSSFVGMVHVLNTTSTKATETMVSLAASMQEQFKMGGWFADASGGFGVDSSFTNDAKALLSTQAISSHCTLITMGSIPSIKSNTVKLAVQQFANFDGAESMKQVAALQNATAGDKDSVDASAAAARTGQQMVSMKNATVKGVLEGLSTIDDGQNRILDINSLMSAMDDYIAKALDGNIGVPINFYLKQIPKPELAKMWVDKYFPKKFMSAQGGAPAPAPAPSGQ